ncbi:hypothetical protein HMPREF0083_02075 [Aneurinibacillus aneurinilyticus ATCC 12856]|uniref:Uncharacterized protein n=1 Tax=Aneurinibacillus aneurinilyticus ATCC 12856 TaxID=649747 RepID=U1YCK5_ANEAE|nr:hypothetical protein HMPREF0083_02075 [Aneurinibacillus aneurinilyticus ATCC 12856]
MYVPFIPVKKSENHPICPTSVPIRKNDNFVKLTANQLNFSVVSAFLFIYKGFVYNK